MKNVAQPWATEDKNGICFSLGVTEPGNTSWINRCLINACWQADWMNEQRVLNLQNVKNDKACPLHPSWSEAEMRYGIWNIFVSCPSFGCSSVALITSLRTVLGWGLLSGTSLTAFPSNPCWLWGYLPGELCRFRGKAPWGTKSNQGQPSRRRVSKGNVHLGSRLGGGGAGNPLPLLVMLDRGSYELTASLSGDVKILWSPLPTPNCPIFHLTPWDTEQPQICGFVEVQTLP